MPTERDMQAEIWEAVGKFSVMFRNNVGAMKNDKGFWVSFGLVKGSSDLIGWTPVEITQDMIGQHLAVFTAIECKNATRKATDEQQYFIGRVQADGGFAGVARSVEDALKIIERNEK